MNYDKSYYHNEIELIKTDNMDLKNKIEKAFLRNRISYFIRWEKPSIWRKLFSGNHQECRICINDWDKEKALEILGQIDESIGSDGELLLKRTENLL